MVVVRVQELWWHMDVRSRLDINKGRQAMADRHRGAGSGFWGLLGFVPRSIPCPKNSRRI